MSSKVEINQASREQLMKFATDVLNLEVPVQANANTLRKRLVEAGYKHDYIELDARSVYESAAKPVLPENGEADPSEGYVEITIAGSQEEADNQPVFVAVNAVGMRIPRGEKVVIPRKYFEALNNAKIQIYPRDKNGTIVGDPRESHRYPFTVTNTNAPAPSKAGIV